MDQIAFNDVALQTAMDMAKAGERYMDIARTLNNRGLKTNNNKPFNDKQVSKMLIDNGFKKVNQKPRRAKQPAPVEKTEQAFKVEMISKISNAVSLSDRQKSYLITLIARDMY